VNYHAAAYVFCLVWFACSPFSGSGSRFAGFRGNLVILVAS
jgi:hypothetical protein